MVAIFQYAQIPSSRRRRFAVENTRRERAQARDIRRLRHTAAMFSRRFTPSSPPDHRAAATPPNFS